MKKPYLDLKDCWEDIPACRSLAERLVETDDGFRRLGPTQLLRHIAGLRFQRPKNKIRLVYLYYDAIGPEAEEHRAEIHKFQSIIANDGLRFIPMTVQDFIVNAFNRCRERHKKYVDYLTDRYL